MSKTNCINCGAAKEVEEIKCPFCGTVYLDMTNIDFSGRTPVILKFIDPFGKKVAIIKARPVMAEIKSEYCSIYESVNTGVDIRFQEIKVITTREKV